LQKYYFFTFLKKSKAWRKYITRWPGILSSAIGPGFPFQKQNKKITKITKAVGLIASTTVRCKPVRRRLPG